MAVFLMNGISFNASGFLVLMGRGIEVLKLSSEATLFRLWLLLKYFSPLFSPRPEGASLEGV